MSLDLGAERVAMARELSRLLDDHDGRAASREALEGRISFDRVLWEEMGRLGWLAVGAPEDFGGQGADPEMLCAVAYEVGRSLAAVPFASSICLAAGTLAEFGSDELKARHLPGLLSGERIGTMAMFEGPGSDPVRDNTASVRARRLSGRKTAVPDGAIADLVVVVAESEGQPGLFLAARGEGLEVRPAGGIDPSHPPAVMVFDGAPVERLGAAGRHDLDRSLDRAAVLIAFEQLGTADAALELARTYALQRKAFGRAIGSFQAIKHKLVDVWTANELARANAHYAAWCLAVGADDSALAAATSWVAAAEAGERAARELIQLHGGIGVTWEHDAHLFYRRARHLSLALGGTAGWRRALVTGLANRTAGI